MNWQIKYHFDRLIERTKICPAKIKEAINFIEKKYNLDSESAVRYISNALYDGKLVIDIKKNVRTKWGDRNFKNLDEI